MYTAIYIRPFYGDMFLPRVPILLPVWNGCSWLVFRWNYERVYEIHHRCRVKKKTDYAKNTFGIYLEYLSPVRWKQPNRIPFISKFIDGYSCAGKLRIAIGNVSRRYRIYVHDIIALLLRPREKRTLWRGCGSGVQDKSLGPPPPFRWND